MKDNGADSQQQNQTVTVNILLVPAQKKKHTFLNTHWFLIVLLF